MGSKAGPDRAAIAPVHVQLAFRPENRPTVQGRRAGTRALAEVAFAMRPKAAPVQAERLDMVLVKPSSKKLSNAG